MKTLPQGCSIQPITLGDVARFVNSYARCSTRRDAMPEARLRTQLTAPGLDLATSAQLIRDPNDDPAAAGTVSHREPHVTVCAWGLVDETHLGLGIGRCLHGRILERARAAIEMAPGGARVVLLRNTLDGDVAANAFLEATVTLKHAATGECQSSFANHLRLPNGPTASPWPRSIRRETSRRSSERRGGVPELLRDGRRFFRS